MGLGHVDIFATAVYLELQVAEPGAGLGIDAPALFGGDDLLGGELGLGGREVRGDRVGHELREDLAGALVVILRTAIGLGFVDVRMNLDAKGAIPVSLELGVGSGLRAMENDALELQRQDRNPLKDFFRDK